MTGRMRVLFLCTHNSAQLAVDRQVRDAIDRRINQKLLSE
jgi:hypothetical protein